MNPFVEYLNSLRTQDQDSNPNYVEENRAEHLTRLRAEYPWFPSDEKLRVATRIRELLSAMRKPDFLADLVFLTGDAGDGKTAACVDLASGEGVSRPLAPIDDAGPWRIVKDASELPEEELLAEIDRSRKERRRLLVAINEGRLRRLQQRSTLRDLWQSIFEPSLASWIDEGTAEALDRAMRDRRVLVVNFRHRMHVRSVAPALLETWSRADYWDGGPSCSTCPAKARCPILANIQSLRQPLTAGRLTDTLTLAHYAGQRLPFRRLQAVLAFAVTGGLRCRDIHGGREPRLADRYYSLLFQRDSSRGFRPEPIARALAPADPGLASDSESDAAVASLLRQGGSLEPFDNAALELSKGREIVDTYRALRRRQLFQAPDSGPAHEPETWRQALGLLEGASERNEDTPLLKVIIDAINRLHRLDTTLEVALTHSQLEPATFRDPARACLELDLGTRFTVALAKGPAVPRTVGTWLESCPTDIEVRAWPEGQSPPQHPARLHIDARLVIALLDVRKGFSFIPALGTHRREFARFQAQLLTQVKESDVQILLRSGSRAWMLATSEGKLRFEGRA